MAQVGRVEDVGGGIIVRGRILAKLCHYGQLGLQSQLEHCPWLL